MSLGLGTKINKSDSEAFWNPRKLGAALKLWLEPLYGIQGQISTPPSDGEQISSWVDLSSSQTDNTATAPVVVHQTTADVTASSNIRLNDVTGIEVDMSVTGVTAGHFIKVDGNPAEVGEVTVSSINSSTKVVALSEAITVITGRDLRFQFPGLVFNTSNGVLTVGRSGLTDLTVDLDGRYSTTDTNYYASSLSFSTSTGVLTVGRSGLSNLTVDLDGRYLDSSSSLSATNLTGTIDNNRLPTSIDLGTAGSIKTNNVRTSGQTNNLTQAGYHLYHAAGGFEALTLVKNSNGYGTALFLHRLSTAGTGNLIEFQYNNSGVGNINTNGSQSFFSGGSDYRLKQDVENITDAITKIKSLRPVKFRWKNNPGLGYDSGFIAHEIQETGHYDHLVTGEKDGMRKKSDDPNQLEPDYQGVYYGKFTPMLVAALKEISDKVDALDTRLTSLENT